MSLIDILGIAADYFLTVDFWENVTAGVAVAIVELVIVVIAIGAIIRYYERRSWKGTRQRLAYVLTSSLWRIMRHVDRMMQEIDGRIVFNRDIALMLSETDVNLRNFHSQTIVHLPSFLPDLSEDLSNLSGKVTGLEETVSSLRYTWPQCRNAFTEYGLGLEDARYVASDLFIVEKSEDGLRNTYITLKADAEKTSELYFISYFFNMIERLDNLVDAFWPVFDKYHNNWQGRYFDQKRGPKSRRVRAIEKVKEIREIEKRLGKYHRKFRSEGIYLQLHVPNLKGEVREGLTPIGDD